MALLTRVDMLDSHDKKNVRVDIFPKCEVMAGSQPHLTVGARLAAMSLESLLC
jgi:hypothetical protein